MKSDTGAAFTVNVTIVDCVGVRLLSVALIVTGNEPVGVFAAVVMVNVVEPDPVNVVGENVPLALAGRPLTKNCPDPV